jgi:hypothetical protein
VPSLFRRKPADLVEEAVSATASGGTGPAGPAPAEETGPAGRPRAYTPSKKERGVVTPKRPSTNVRQVKAAPANRREAARLSREERRERRQEITEGMRRGDDRYLLNRDKGPERALVRDIVDSRRNVGTWFFASALVVLIGSSTALPESVRLVSTLLWAAVACAVIVDGWLICMRVRKLIHQRFPRTGQRLGSLYLYAVMRSITFRRMRMPQPRVKIGDKV